MWDTASAGVAVAGKRAAMEDTKNLLDQPVATDVAGWAAAESIKFVLARARGTVEHDRACQLLLKCLSDDRLHSVVDALDQLTDLPKFQSYRPDYQELCEALEEAEVMLLSNTAAKQTDTCFGICKWLHWMLNAGRPQAARTSLEQFYDIQKYAQLLAALERRQPPAGPSVRASNEALDLQPYLGHGRGQPRFSEPDLPPHIFQHCDDLVPHIDEQLRSTRNIGIVGMGGIGKTTIARAVYERAKRRFGASVWLPVGKDATDMLPLLESAFDELFQAGLGYPFETAEQGLQALAQQLYSEGRSVLLVLDDVWRHDVVAVLAALNFATRANMRVDGSRLIVTTRDIDVLSCSPGREGARLMHELKVFEPRRLEDECARQLLYHHAFGAADATPHAYVAAETCSELIQTCGGNALALKVLGCALQHCKTAEEWGERLAAQRAQKEKGEDDATTTCATSVAALPPSLKECFIDFAAFPEDARVRETTLLHLFAAHAPLHTPASFAAAAAKLDQLVRRGLVARKAALSAQEMHEYYMHDILRRIALLLSREPERGRYFCATGIGSQPALSWRSFSAHETINLHSAPQEALSKQIRSGSKRMQTCILGNVVLEAQGKWPSMPRLQLLSLHERMDRQQAAAELSPDPRGVSWPMLRFVKLHVQSSACLPDAVLPVAQLPALAHLDLSQCTSLTQLPDGISACSHLTYLDLFRCRSLRQLPEGIGGCSQLQHLNCSYCKSLEELPEGISGCSQLKHLDLYWCSKLEELPEGIRSCSQLTFLDLTCEGLTRTPEGVSRCSQLKHLVLRCCTTLEQLPEGFSGCSQLQFLSLIGYKFLNTLPGGMKGWSRLQHLDVRGCANLKQIPDGISGCRQLTHLKLMNCKSLEKLPEGISSCSRLVRLDLDHCSSLKHLPDGIRGCKQLTHLNLLLCKSLEQLPEGIGSCDQLKHLNLDSCYSLEQLTEGISGCNQLQHLNLSCCSKIAELPEGISKCRQLKHLELDCCSSLQQLPEGIDGCSELRRLSMRWCKRLTHLPEGISRCRHLTHLDLADCNGIDVAALPKGVRRKFLPPTAAHDDLVLYSEGLFYVEDQDEQA